MPTARDDAAELSQLGRLGIDVKRLRIEALGKGYDFVAFNRDTSEAMDITLDIIFEVAAVEWGLERHRY
jgi:hypothetical protein